MMMGMRSLIGEQIYPDQSSDRASTNTLPHPKDFKSKSHGFSSRHPSRKSALAGSHEQNTWAILTWEGSGIVAGVGERWFALLVPLQDLLIMISAITNTAVSTRNDQLKGRLWEMHKNNSWSIHLPSNTASSRFSRMHACVCECVCTLWSERMCDVGSCGQQTTSWPDQDTCWANSAGAGGGWRVLAH